MTQHAELTAERWSRFDLGQQILQIGVEMQRASASLRPDRLESLRNSYERTMRLVTDYLAPRPAAEREAVCGGNALRFWRLETRP